MAENGTEVGHAGAGAGGDVEDEDEDVLAFLDIMSELDRKNNVSAGDKSEQVIVYRVF
jgi:hypothetical protein